MNVVKSWQWGQVPAKTIAVEIWWAARRCRGSLSVYFSRRQILLGDFDVRRLDDVLFNMAPELTSRDVLIRLVDGVKSANGRARG